MEKTYIIYLEATALFVFTLIGGIVSWRATQLSKKKNKLFPIFAGSYLFTMTLLHMLPELFEGVRHSHDYPKVGLYLVLGFFFQLFLDFLEGGEGIAHNHAHITQHKKKSKGFMLFFSLLFHALLEGIYIEKGHHGTLHPLFLIISLLLHKIPVAAAMLMALHQRKWKTHTGLISLILFALATPLAWIVMDYLQQTHHNALTPFLMPLSSIAIGSILNISTTIIFESDPHHQFTRSRWVAILPGVLIPIIIEFALPHAH